MKETIDKIHRVFIRTGDSFKALIKILAEESGDFEEFCNKHDIYEGELEIVYSSVKDLDGRVSELCRKYLQHKYRTLHNSENVSVLPPSISPDIHDFLLEIKLDNELYTLIAQINYKAKKEVEEVIDDIDTTVIAEKYKHIDDCKTKIDVLKNLLLRLSILNRYYFKPSLGTEVKKKIQKIYEDVQALFPDYILERNPLFIKVQIASELFESKFRLQNDPNDIGAQSAIIKLLFDSKKRNYFSNTLLDSIFEERLRIQDIFSSTNLVLNVFIGFVNDEFSITTLATCIKWLLDPDTQKAIIAESNRKDFSKSYKFQKNRLIFLAQKLKEFTEASIKGHIARLDESAAGPGHYLQVYFLLPFEIFLGVVISFMNMLDIIFNKIEDRHLNFHGELEKLTIDKNVTNQFVLFQLVQKKGGKDNAMDIVLALNNEFLDKAFTRYSELFNFDEYRLMFNRNFIRSYILAYFAEKFNIRDIGEAKKRAEAFFGDNFKSWGTEYLELAVSRQTLAAELAEKKKKHKSMIGKDFLKDIETLLESRYDIRDIINKWIRLYYEESFHEKEGELDNPDEYDEAEDVEYL